MVTPIMKADQTMGAADSGCTQHKIDIVGASSDSKWDFCHWYFNPISVNFDRMKNRQFTVTVMVHSHSG